MRSVAWGPSDFGVKRSRAFSRSALRSTVAIRRIYLIVIIGSPAPFGRRKQHYPKPCEDAPHSKNFTKPRAVREQSRRKRFRSARRQRMALKTPGLKLEFGDSSANSFGPAPCFQLGPPASP